MKQQELQQTFYNCAEFGINIEEHPDCAGSKDAVMQEADYQLCNAMACLLSAYGLEKEEVGITFDFEESNEEQSIMRIARNDEKEMPKYVIDAIRASADGFIEKFASFIGEKDIGINRGGQFCLAEIRYERGDMHDALWSLVTQKHPSNYKAMAHLNTLTHIMGRLDNYMPAIHMN